MNWKAIAVICLFGFLFSGANAASLGSGDFFIELESNTDQCLTECESVFLVRNPFLTKSIPLEAVLGVRFEDKALRSTSIGDYNFLIEEDVVKQRLVYGKRQEEVFHEIDDVYGLSCTQRGFADFNSTHCVDSYIVSYFSHKEEYFAKEFVPITGKTELASFETARIKLVGKKKPREEVDWIPFFDFGKDQSFLPYYSNLENQKIEKKEWAWWNASWPYKQRLDMNTSWMGADVSNSLPILVHIDSSNADFWANVRSDGYDIRFIDSTETTDLNWHFEDWNYAVNDANIWVRPLSFISSGDENIYLYYGNAAAGSDPQDRNGTYDENFVQVFHLDDASGGLSDETSNDNDGTEAGDPTYDFDGQIGKCVDFDGVGDWFDIGEATSGEAEGTVMLWFNTDDSGITQNTAFGSRDGGPPTEAFFIHCTYQNPGFDICWLQFETGDVPGHDLYLGTAGDGSIANSTWYHIAFTWGGGGGNFYRDGDVNDTDAETTVMATVGVNYFLGAGGGIGADPTDGRLDDFKLSNRQLSANEIKLIYKSETVDFIVFNAQESDTDAPDVNVIEPTDGNYLTGGGSYEIIISVQDPDTNAFDLNVDVNYHTSQAIGGTAIFTDSNLSTWTCDSNNLATPQLCRITWDPIPSIDANRYLVVNIMDGDNNTANWGGSFRIDTPGRPDINIVQPNGVDGNYLLGGANAGIVFEVQDDDAGEELHVRLAYSANTGAFETDINADLNLNNHAVISGLDCDDIDWTDSTECIYTWSVPSLDNNFFIDANVWDSVDLNSRDSSDASFEIDSTAPTTTSDRNAGWFNSDQNIHLACVDDTPWDLNSATHDNVTINTQDSLPQGIAFNDDGTLMYEVGDTDNNIYQYALTTAFDLSTASFDGNTINTQDSNPQDIEFNDDGTLMYEVGGSDDNVYQYVLSTAWNIGTATFDGNTINTQDSSPRGIAFRTDGTKMYEIGSSDDNIYQYSLAVAWNIGTATYDSVTIETQDSVPRDLAFMDDGTRMYEIGLSKDKFYQYTLSTAWDLSTATSDDINIDTQDSEPHGLAFNSDGTKMYEIGSNGDNIYQYTLTGSGCSATKYSIDSGAWQTFDQNILFDSDGNKQLDFNSVDVAGNNEAMNTTWVAVDKTIPTIANVIPVNASTVSSRTVSFDANDVTSGVSQSDINVTIGGVASGVFNPVVDCVAGGTGYHCSYTETGISTGVNTIVVDCNDEAGNSAVEATSTFTFVLPPDVNIVAPNGGEIWTGQQNIDFNIFNYVAAELHVHIAYSAVSGGFTNDLNTDLNLNNHAALSYLTCSGTDWTASQDCQFVWNTWEALDGTYYVDINVFRQDNKALWDENSSAATFETRNAPDFNTTFNYVVDGNLDPENGVTTVRIDLNSVTDVNRVSPASYQWDENGAPISTDENVVNYLDGNSGDRNFALTVTYDYDYNSDTFTDQNWRIVHINEYPQALDWNNDSVPVNLAKDFNATATDNRNIIAWCWDFNDGTTGCDQNTSHTFTAVGDFNVCLEVEDDEDLNKQRCQNQVVSGSATFRFIDENSGVALQPTILFDGNSIDANTDGFAVVDLNGLATKTYVLTAEDANRSLRYFEFDLNQFSVENYVLMLLPTTLGQEIAFQFYEPDQVTLLGDARISIFFDVNIVSIRTTDASGFTSFFLDNNVPGYDFNIEASDGNTYHYTSTKVIVNEPRRESDGTLIDLNASPFDVTVRTLKVGDFLDKNVPVEFPIYSNTVDRYLITVDVNADFFERKFQLNVRGNPVSVELNPFLAEVDIGLSPTLRTINIITNDPVPETEVRIYKVIEGFGRSLMEQVVTDDKGEALVSGITNDDYEFEVYFGGTLVRTLNITMTGTLIVISFYPGEATDLVEIGTVGISFTPFGGKLDENVEILSQFVFVDANAPSVSSIKIYATSNDVNLFSDTIVVISAVNQNDINIVADLAAWDSNYSLVITVDVLFADGNILRSTAIYAEFDLNRWQDVVWRILTGDIFATIGCSPDSEEPCGILMMISLFLTMIACGALVIATPLRDPQHIAAISVVILGFFTFIGWISLFLFALYFIIVLFGLIALWKVQV